MMNRRDVPLKQIICPVCGDTNIIKKGFREQKRTHVNVQLYKCNACGCKFTPRKAKEAQVGKKHQTGRTSVALDKTRKALPPGIRTTAWGTKYPEYRRNRSDVNPEKML
jgi:predicted RNA-binding Zn-ribbon protein involved in translation (DUF1610 family)